MNWAKALIFVAFAHLTFLGCAPTQVHLNDQLDEDSLKALASQTPCALPYTLRLDKPSSELVITQYPNGLHRGGEPAKVSYWANSFGLP